MQNGLFTACDFRTKIIDGVKGTAKVDEPYLSIKGTLLLVYKDEKGVKRYYYPTPKTGELLHFCNGSCFDSYCSAKTFQRQEYFKNNPHTDTTDYWS